MCHAEARAQDARRRACRHRLKMVGPSKASPTQRHNDRGADRATARYYPTLAGSPSRSPDRGPGGESQFFAAPPESQSTRTLDTPRAGFMGRDGGRAPPACAQHQHRQGFTSVCWRRLPPPYFSAKSHCFNCLDRTWRSPLNLAIDTVKAASLLETATQAAAAIVGIGDDVEVSP